MSADYEVVETDDNDWPAWYFVTPEGLQVTVTAGWEGTETIAQELAAELAKYTQRREA